MKRSSVDDDAFQWFDFVGSGPLTGKDRDSSPLMSFVYLSL